MPTPLELAGAYGGPRGGIQMYDPRLQQRLPAAQRQVAPTSRTNGQPQRAGTKVKDPLDPVAAYQRSLANPELNAPPEPEKPDNPLGGLGWVINNPIAKGLMKPFEVLDYGRRAVTLGMEEFAEGITGDELAGTIGDTRSNMEKLKDPTYGVGQLLGNSVPGGKWVDRTVGLIGDIAFDPLTYITAGVGGVIGKSGRAAVAAEARGLGAKLAAEAAEQGAEELVQKAITSKWDDVSRQIGRYGPGVVKDPEVLERLGLQRQGLRLGMGGEGLRIGGNTRLGDALGEGARAVNTATAKLRAGFYDTGLGTKLASWRTPELINKAHRVIRSGAEEAEGMRRDVALALYTYHDADRLSSKAFRGEVAPGYTALSNKTRGEAAVAATHAAEGSAEHTAWNMYADELLKKAEEAGVQIDKRKNFVPHIVTPEGMDILRSNEELRQATGVMVTQLDDPSGVTLQRQLTGFSGPHTVAGKTVDFGDGTIQAANKAMKEAFGIDKFFEDDITTIYSKYVNRLSSDVGHMKGLERLSEVFPDLVKMSDDPEEMLDIFHGMIDEVATTTANQEIVTKLKARLSNVNREIGTFQKAADDAIEQGRSILSGAAKENLDQVRTLRTETRKSLANLVKNEKSLVTQRDKIVTTLDAEVENMSERMDELRTQINHLTAQQNAAYDTIRDTRATIDLKQRAQARATEIGAKKRLLQGQHAELEADAELLDTLTNRLRTSEVKEKLLSRVESEAPTPRPVSAEARARAVPQGESYVALAGGEGPNTDPRVTEWMRQNPDAPHVITPEELDLNEVLAANDGQLPPFDPSAKIAEAAQKAQLNRGEVIGDRTEMVPRASRNAGVPSEQDVKALYDLRREAAQNEADMEELRQLFGPEFGGNVDVEAERLLPPAEKSKLTNARRLREKAKDDIDQFLDSDAGEQWLDDIEELDGAGNILRNPQHRYKLPEFAANAPKGHARIEVEAAKEELAFLESERMRYAGLRRSGQSGKLPNPGASQAIEAEIAHRQTQIAEAERLISEAETKGFGETRKVVTEGAVNPRTAEEAVPVVHPGDTPRVKRAGQRLENLAKERQELYKPTERPAVTSQRDALKRMAKVAERKKTIEVDIKAARQEYEKAWEISKRDLGKEATTAKVRPSGAASQFVDQQKSKIAKLESEVEDLKTRLTDQQQGQQLNQGAARARLTSKINETERGIADTKVRVAKAEARVKTLERKTQARTTQFKKLQKRVADNDKTVRTIEEKLRPARPAADQSHLSIHRRLAAIDQDEAEAMARRSMKERDEGFAPNITMRSAPKMRDGRLRLPRTQSQIEEDIQAMENAGVRSLPKDPAKRKLVTSTAVEIPYDVGAKDVRSLADRVLMSSETANPYRALLAHTGAISEEQLMAHNRMNWELRFAMDKAKESPSAINTQNMVIASDRLRRANEFMVKYGKAIDSGIEPSDGVAERIARQITDSDVDRLNRTIADIRANPEKMVDQEAESITEGLLNAIYDQSAAASLKERVNTMFNQKNLTPAQETAYLENEQRNTEGLIEWSKANLKKNRSKRTKALNNGDEKAAINAERNIRANERTLSDALAQQKANANRMIELAANAPTKAMEGIRATLETLQGGRMTDEAATELGKVFDSSVVEQLKKFADNSEFNNIVTNEFGEQAVPQSEQLIDFMGDLMNKAGLSYDQFEAPLPQIERAAKTQAAQEMEDARSLFSQVFDDLGMKRVGDMSKEKTVGYKTSNQSLSHDQLKRAVANQLEKNRGMSAQDYVIRQLEYRRNRLESATRGMGRRSRPGKDLERLPAGFEDALEEVNPQRRMAAVAKAQRMQPIEDLRDARMAARAAGENTPMPSTAAVDWQETIFGNAITPRAEQPIRRAQGEQAARGLLNTAADIPRPGGPLTRNAPAAQMRVLEEELAPHLAAREGIESRLADVRKVNETVPAHIEDLKAKVKQGTKDVGETQRQIDSVVGSSLTPEIDDALKRTVEKYEPKIKKAVEEMDDLQTKRAAFEKGRDKAIQKIAPDLQKTREDIRLVNEVLEGYVPPPIEMPPIGGFKPEVNPHEMPQGINPVLPVVPDFPTGKQPLALPAAGESAASRSLDQKFAEAEAIAKRTTKNTAGVAQEMGGAKMVSDEFNSVMAEMGLPKAETLMVRTIMADAVGLEAGAEMLGKGAKALENAIAKGHANELATVMSQPMLLGTWHEMATELLRGADVPTRVFMHQELDKYFTRINEVLPTNRFWKAVEAYTNFFKTYATLRPDFHVRNAMSAMFMNSSDGVPIHYNFKALQLWHDFMKDPEFMTKLRNAPEGATRGMNNAKLAESFEAALGSGAGGQFAERGVSDSRRRLVNNKLTRGSKKVGEYVEGPVRLAMAMDTIEKGGDKFKALTRITRIHFDYSEVSNFDQVAKRMIPFWTFMSRNMPLQVTQMLSKPKWYAWANSFQRNFMEEGDPMAPDYWGEGGGFQLPSGNVFQKIAGTDDPMWLTPDLAHNRLQSDLTDWVNTATLQDTSALTNFNPLFTVPLELAMHKDLFTGREYQPEDVQQLGGLEKMLSPLFSAIGQNTNGFVPEQMLQAGRSLIPTYDQAARLFPGAVTGNQSQLDKERQAETWMRRLGMPVRQLTPQVKENNARSEYYDEQELYRKWLATQGAA